MPRSLTLLWVVGVFVCFLDYPVIPVGGSALKVAYLVFPFLFSFVLLHNNLRINKRHALLGALFVAGVLPSVVFSSDIKISLAFLLGVGVCLTIMSSMYVLTKAVGMRAVGMLVWIYRITVIITVPLFVSGLQYRGHFTLYEASYWSIALIPYYCIAFHKLLTGGKRAFVVDGLFILTAIIVSESVSMVMWAIISFVGLLIAMRRVRIRSVLVAAMTLSVLGVIAYKYSARAEDIFNAVWNIADWDAVLNIFILIGGNRLQRAVVAYQAMHDHPIFGVGLGALRGFTDLHFRADDFSLTRMSALDFDTSKLATNVLLELTAECGIIGPPLLVTSALHIQAV
jgi:hypothetical protein